jgi:hypothetical protein
LETLFSTLSAQPASSGGFPALTPVPDPGIHYVERRDIRRTFLSLGLPGGKMNDPDFPAMLVLAEILGAGPGTRLGEMAKAQPSWQATLQSSWNSDEIYPGVLQISGSLNAPFTTDAVKSLLEIIAQLGEGAFTANQVEAAQARVSRSLALRFNRPSVFLYMRMVEDYYGIPAGHLISLYDGARSVSRDTLTRVARERLNPSAAVIVVVGSETLFDHPLSILGRRVTPLNIDIPAPKPLEPRTDPENVAEGRKWLLRFQQSMGGAEKLASIQDCSLRGEGVAGVTGSTRIRTFERWLAPQTFRLETGFGDRVDTFFYNGQIGWISANKKLSPLPDPLLAAIRGEIFRLLFRLALSDRNPKAVVFRLGPNIIGISTEGGLAVKFHMDESTGLPQRMSYQSVQIDGSYAAVEENFVSWQEVDGIKWPLRVVTKRNGRRASEITYSEVKFNSGLKDAGLIQKP